MKRKIAFCLIVGLLLLLITSCNESPKTGNLRVELNKGYKTITPNNSRMDIIGYRIVPTGPDGKVGSTRYTYYSYCNLENLALGKWKLEAYGFNSDRVDVAYGSTEVNITASDNTALINAHQLVGKGILKLEFTWEAGNVQDPVLKLYLKALNDNENEKELFAAITRSEGKASVTETNLNAGSYSLRGELFDGDKKVAGFMEAIRISNEETTSGVIPLEVEKLDDENNIKPPQSNVDISNTTSTPIEFVIEGVEKVVAKDKSFTAKITVSSKNINLNDIKALWYLDGVQIGSGLSCIIKPTTFGEHRIDVIASTNKQGSAGSQFATFSTVTTTKPGMPYSLSQINTSKVSLGNDNVIRFLPNGRLIIANNEMYTFQLFAIEDEGLRKLRAYSYSDLNIDGSISDVGASGTASDENLTIYAVSSDPAVIYALSYTRSGDTVAYKGEMRNIKSGKGDPLVNLGPVLGVSNGGYLRTTIVAASTMNHTNKGFLLLNPNPSSSDTDYIILNNFYVQNYYGDGPVYSIDYSEASDAVTMVTGTVGIVDAFRESSSGGISINPTPVIDDYSKIEKRNFESLNRGRMGRIFNKRDLKGYVLADDALFVYAKSNTESRTVPLVQNDKSFKFTSHRGKIPSLKGSFDNKYFYMLDNLCKKLYVLTFENGAFACDETNDFINIPTTQYNDMEISRDGGTIILYNRSCPSHDIAILRVSR